MPTQEADWVHDAEMLVRKHIDRTYSKLMDPVPSYELKVLASVTTNWAEKVVFSCSLDNLRYEFFREKNKEPEIRTVPH